MACWTIQTVSLEFKAEHKDFLMEAAVRLGLKAQYIDNLNIVRISGSFAADIYLKEQKVVTNSFYATEVNKLRVEYSKVIVERVAQAKKWVLAKKNQQGTKMELKRF